MARVNIKQLEAFVHVADQASFRRAAAALNTTQPNISARIASLENSIGQKLMERDSGSVVLTTSGKVLLEKARNVVQALDEFLVATDQPGLFEGTLRLGATEMVVHTWLGKFLEALRERFPNINTELTVDLSANLSTALFNQTIDLALQSGPFNRRSSGTVNLGSYPMVWVASPSLHIPDRVLSFQSLTQQPILTHARQTLPFQQLEKHVAGRRGVRLVPSTSLSACMRMTVEGLGIACLPDAMVGDEIEQGNLVQLEYSWVPDNLTFQARFHAERAPHYLSEAASLAADMSANSIS